LELKRSLPEDRAFTNFRRMLRRFNSREVPGADVLAVLGSSSSGGVTDEEGYFDLPVPTPELTRSKLHDDWYSGNVQVVACPVPGFKPVSAEAEVMIPSASAELGVISDIDDTVLQTYVTRKLKMLWVTLAGNPFTRLAFEGTSELYKALVTGFTGAARNPVFYVSKSPWNLYDFLVEFMDRNDLPRGPLLLRDIGLHEKPPLDFKTAAVEQVLDTYPELPFVLIGDSGERDPDIYMAVAAKYPGRIRAIYIRDVGLHSLRQAQLAKMMDEAKALGTELLLVTHASQALDHARSIGLAPALS
jgi:phosphatidate phosphatase APP1